RRGRACLGATAGADAGDLDRVPGHREAVRGAEIVEPRVELALAQLDDAMTLRADEMVVVPFAAEAIADLARTMDERVDHTLLREQRERAVHGREADRLASG